MSFDWRSAVRAHVLALSFWANFTPTTVDDQVVKFCTLAVENDDVGALVDVLLAGAGLGASAESAEESLADFEARAEAAATPAAREALAAAGINWKRFVKELLPVILAALLK